MKKKIQCSKKSTCEVPIVYEDDMITCAGSLDGFLVPENVEMNSFFDTNAL